MTPPIAGARGRALPLILVFLAALLACNGAEGRQSSGEARDLRQRVDTVRSAMASKAKTHDLSSLVRLGEAFDRAYKARDIRQARALATVIEKQALRVPRKEPLERVEAAPLSARSRPSMMFSPEEWDELSRRDSPRHRELRGLLRSWADAHASESFEPRITRGWDSTDRWKQKGHKVRLMAFCGILFGDDRYVNRAKDWALALARYPRLGLDRDVVDLDLQDPVKGLAAAYDWLYERFTPGERAEIAAQLGRAGERTEAALMGELRDGAPVYWARQFNGNHNHHGFNALLQIALALREAHPRSGAWFEMAARDFEQVLELGEGVSDGSWNEGVCYGTYGESDVLQALWLLEQNGRELDGGADWLRAGALWYAHTTTPMGLSAGYSDTTGKWFSGPHHILAYLDRRFRDGYGRWLAESPLMASNAEQGARIDAIPFEWVWHDPAVESHAPEKTWRFFDDWGVLTARTGWGTDDTYFSFKAGPFGGKHRAERFLASDPLAREIAVSHEHPDAGSFELVDGARFVVSDTLYADKKETVDHPTILIDGMGMVGEGVHWPDPYYSVLYGDSLTEFVFAGREEGVLAASARFERMYSPDLGVEHCQRTVCWLEDRSLLVVDHVRTTRLSQVSTLFWNVGETLVPKGASTRVGGDGFWSIDHLWPAGVDQRTRKRPLFKTGLKRDASGVEVRGGAAAREHWRCSWVHPAGVASGATAELTDEGLRVTLAGRVVAVTDAGLTLSGGSGVVRFP